MFSVKHPLAHEQTVCTRLCMGQALFPTPSYTAWVPRLQVTSPEEGLNIETLASYYQNRCWSKVKHVSVPAKNTQSRSKQDIPTRHAYLYRVTARNSKAIPSLEEQSYKLGFKSAMGYLVSYMLIVSLETELQN